MKKFTGNFLLGEHSLGNVLRKIGLSMVAILMAVGVFAQPQETLHVWADDVSDCYRGDNSYSVPVRMRDFVKIDTFSLELRYSKNVLDYTGLTINNSVLSTMQVAESSASSTLNKLVFTWDSNDAPKTINPDDDTTLVFTLHFELDVFPEVYVYNSGGDVINPLVKSSDLDWYDANCKYWNVVNEITNILTFIVTDGSLTINQEIEDVEVDDTMADCFGSDAVVTVTSPVGTGYLYSWNGNTFTTNPTTDVVAPSTNNTLVVKNGSCISYTKQFDVDAPEVLSFSAEDTVYTDCPGGLGDIEIFADGGTGNYTYYIVPDAKWAEVEEDFDQATNKTERNNAVAIYATSNNIIQRAPGTYWVAVQDGNECVDLGDVNHMSWWQKVEVIDDKDPWLVSAIVTDALCYDYPNGKFSISVDGASPFANGYNVWVNDVYKGRYSTYNSPTDLVAGTYNIHVTDSLGCSWDSVLVVDQPDPIVFDLDHTDASCEAPNGTITIDLSSIEGGNGSLDSWWWVYSTSPDFAAAYTDTIPEVSQVADSLAPAVYYVRVFDSVGCYADYRNVNGDNAVKVLTTEFDLVYDEIECNGGTTDVSIVLTTGAGNHTFKYAYREGTYPDTTGLGAAAWQNSNTFEDLGAGTYSFYVYDVTIGCVLAWVEEIEEPAQLMVWINNMLTLPPSCPGNTDGNLVVWAWGGTPFESGDWEYYEYKIDDNDWVQASNYNTFAVDTAHHHILVRDANGCTAEAIFDWPNRENILDFVDTIYNECALGRINLFNRYPNEGCHPDWMPSNGGDVANGPFYFWEPGNWDCPEGVDLDFGYLNYFEWYGEPIEHFTGTITFDINIWTSDSGWVNYPLQGIQQFRNPVLYVTDVNPDGDPQAVVDNGSVVGHETSFAAGTYWAVVMDEWGCFSNIEKIVILDPPALEVEINTVAAGCDGSTDGKIMIEAFNGRFPIPNMVKPFARYQYVLTQQPQIFTHENWVEEVTWSVFTNGTFADDSTTVINVQDGTYYLAIRDWCGVENTELIVIAGPIVIEGAAPVEVDMEMVDVKDVTCIVDDEDRTYDGSITGLLAATSGGFGGYTYTLDPVELYDYPEDDIDWPLVNTSGNFTGLPGGDYMLTIEDDSLGCIGTQEITIEQPDPLNLTIDVVNASCFDAHDGLLMYQITGGTYPYEEATNNVGGWEDPNDIPEERWFSTTSEDVEIHDGVFAFDRRVRAGSYEVWVRDANGCIYGPVEVVVDQPAKLQITDVVATKVSCNDQSELFEGDIADGTITFSPVGGWNIEEDGDFVFEYTAELWKVGGTSPIQSQDFNTLEDITFSGLAVGNYIIKLYEYSDDIEDEGYDGPVITEVNYFTDFHNWMEFAPYQNPDLKKCFVTYNVSVVEPEPITYDPIDWRDVKCYNTATGEIYVSNIQGGTMDANSGYWVALEGPFDYTPASGSVVPPSGDTTLKWYKTGKGKRDYTFKKLVHGHYTLHIQDKNGCWIYKESGEIENPDSLEIEVVELVENAKCFDGKGIIQIDAIGGVGPYEYAVDSTLIPHPGFHTFPFADEATYLATLDWQLSDTFHVTSATWIGYVRDANGCVTGYATDKNGNPIYHHRTTVLEPDPVEASDIDEVPVECYGEANGKITIGNAWGGNGGAWTIVVEGTDYAGNAVSEVYTKGKTDKFPWVLTGLPASTDKDADDITDADRYMVTVYDSENCASEVYYQEVTQPEEFMVVLKDKQNAFICPDDKAGIFEIEVVSGGTPFGLDANDEPIYKYKWEAYSDAGYTNMIDSLSDGTWGFTETFLGYAGIYYRVYAQDVNECETTRDTFIQAPTPITFDVQNITCFGDAKGSARISAMGTEGRSFRVLYKEIENDIAPSTWTVYNGWFSESIDIVNTFVYDNENLADVHYAIVIEDTLGCRSAIDTITFDKVQHPLVLTVSVTEEGECTSDIEVGVTGGTPPYMITLDGVEVAAGAHTLAVGTYNFMVADAHIVCTDEATIEITPNPVVRDTTINTFIGESVQFTDVAAGLDTMLVEGEYSFNYMAGECTRTLNVTVVGVPHVLSIAQVQSEADSSAYIGKVVQITGTVSAVANGGFFVQDANAAWSGIWVVSTTAVSEGNGVKVIGTVSEVDKVTTITATSVEAALSPLTVQPVVVASPSAAEAEMYESVLVKVEGARANAADSETGKWTVFTTAGNDAVVNKWLYTSVPVAGHFYDVTGVVNGKNNTYSVEPRKAADVVDLTVTPVQPDLGSVQFKVYPNPFNDRIMIDNNDKLTRVVVSNIAGQRVIDIEYPGHEIRTANLVSGVYVISLITENGIAKTERIIKR